MALAVVVTLYIAADARAPRGASLKEPVLAPYDEDSLGLLGDVVRELQVPVFEHVHDVGPELHGVLQRTVQRQLRRG